MAKKKKELKISKILFFIATILLIILMFSFTNKIINNRDEKYYLTSNVPLINTYDEKYKIIGNLIRGNVVQKLKDINKSFVEIKYNDKKYIIPNINITNDIKKIASETKMYDRTPTSIYEAKDKLKIIGLLTQGTQVDVLDYDYVNKDGIVNQYKIKYNDQIGYVYGKYMEFDKNKAVLPYKDYNLIHSKSGSSLGGGVASNLDYYPYEKPNFKNNVMPKQIYALYLNGGRDVINNVDKYLELVKGTKINAFVIDIKDNESPAYKSPVMQKYSPTNYKYGNNSFEKYKEAIKKIKDAGYYTIGRITVFKDKYYALDNPDTAIADANTNLPFLHSNTYWPSPFQRSVWEFNVALAKEAVKEMGFNEINFDYVRFPDKTIEYEKQGLMNFKNTYNEEKAQAIQRFLMYAADEIHKSGAYVSADVFGESAHKYVSAYGQYYGAISNVVDVISPMPYPDHFSTYEYGFKVPVYTIPYELLNHWAKNVIWHQQNIPTPAITRSWIQAYDSYKNGGYPYGLNEVDAQIRALYDNGLNGGYMTWNSKSSIDKYTQLLDIWKKEYGK